MTFGNGSNSGPNSEDFEEALAELVYEAFLEDIEVEGGWDINMGDRDELPDFTVEIFRMRDQ